MTLVLDKDLALVQVVRGIWTRCNVEVLLQAVMRRLRYSAGNNRRNQWVAGLLSLPLMGLGHIYAGKAKRGLFVFLGLHVLFAFLLILFVFILNIYFLLISAAVFVTYFIFGVVDAVKIAKQHSTSYALKWYNRWYFYIALIMLTTIAQPPFDATVAAEWTKEYLFSTARGTTGSMQPTILPGDRFFVNHLIYRIKKPQHGDIGPVDIHFNQRQMAATSTKDKYDEANLS